MDRLLNAYRAEDLTKRDLSPPVSESIQLGSVLSWGILTFFLSFALWSNYSPIDEGAAVEGSVSAQGNRKTIQHTLGEAQRMAKDPRMVEAMQVQSKLFEARRNEYQISLRTKKRQLELLISDVKNAQLMATEGLLPKLDANNMEREALRQEAELSQLVNARLSKIDSDLSEILGLKEGVQAKVQSLSFDRAQYDVRSPVDGVVSSLRVNTLGGVVTPAQTLMEIVPSSLDYIVEAKVPTHLIGKVSVGMPANLRFIAFDPGTTPVVFGEVTLVGADKVASDKVADPRPENNRAEFYLVRIAIKDDLLVKLKGKPLQPGMPVDVIFKSGERSFMSYLLKPLTDQLSKSFLN